MAAINFTVTRYAPTRGSGAASIRASTVRTSGRTVITSPAGNLSDGAAVTAAAGEVVSIHTDVAIRVAFGGTAATTTTGHYIPANVLWECEVAEPGTISAIEAA